MSNDSDTQIPFMSVRFVLLSSVDGTWGPSPTCSRLPLSTPGTVRPMIAVDCKITHGWIVGHSAEGRGGGGGGVSTVQYQLIRCIDTKITSVLFVSITD